MPAPRAREGRCPEPGRAVEVAGIEAVGGGVDDGLERAPRAPETERHPPRLTAGTLARSSFHSEVELVLFGYVRRIVDVAPRPTSDVASAGSSDLASEDEQRRQGVRLEAHREDSLRIRGPDQGGNRVR